MKQLETMASKNLTGENAHRMPKANSAGINIFESIYSMLNTKPETPESAKSENLDEKTSDTQKQNAEKLQKTKHLFKNMNKNLFELMKGGIGKGTCRENTVKSNTNITSTVLEQNKKRSVLKVLPNTDRNKNKITVSDKIDNQDNNNMVSSIYSDTKCNCLAETKTNHEINKSATETGCNNNESAFEMQPVLNSCTNMVNYVPNIKVEYDVNSANKDKSVTRIKKDKSVTGINKDKSVTRINKDKIVTQMNKDKLVTGINKDKSVTGINKDKLVTGINKGKSVTGINKDKSVTEVNTDKSVTEVNTDKIISEIYIGKSVTRINKDKSITESSIDHRHIQESVVKKSNSVNVSNLKTDNLDSVLEYEDPESLRIKSNNKHEVTIPTNNQVLNCQDLNDQRDCEYTNNCEDHINFDDFVILDEASSSDGEATLATIQTVSPKSGVLKQRIIGKISKQEKEAQSKKSHPNIEIETFAMSIPKHSSPRDSLGSPRFNMSQMSNISYLDVRDGFYSDISDEMGPDISVEIYSDISEDEDVFGDMQKYQKYGKADIGKSNENCPRLMNFHSQKSGLNFTQESELPSIRLKTRNYKTNMSTTCSHYLERHSEKTHNSKAFVRCKETPPKKKTCNSITNNHHSGRHPKSKPFNFMEGHANVKHTAKEICNSTAAHHHEKYTDRKSSRLKERSMHRRTGQSTGSESFKKNSSPRRKPSSLKTKSSPKRVSKKKTNDFKAGKTDSKVVVLSSSGSKSKTTPEKKLSTLNKGDQFIKTIYSGTTKNHIQVTNNLQHKQSKIRPEHSSSYKKLEKNVTLSTEKLFWCAKPPNEKCPKAKSQIDQMILSERPYHCPCNPSLNDSESDQSLSPSALIIVDEANSEYSHCGNSDEEQYKIIDCCLDDEPLVDNIELTDPTDLFNSVASPCNDVLVSLSHVHCKSVITPTINEESSFQYKPSVDSRNNEDSKDEESHFQCESSIEFSVDKASSNKESALQCESSIEFRKNEASTNKQSSFQCESFVESHNIEGSTNEKSSFQSTIELTTEEPTFYFESKSEKNSSDDNEETSATYNESIPVTKAPTSYALPDSFENITYDNTQRELVIMNSHSDVTKSTILASETDSLTIESGTKSLESEINHDSASHPQLNSFEVNSARTNEYYIESSAKENLVEFATNDCAGKCEAKSTLLKIVEATRNMTNNIKTDSDKSVESSLTRDTITQNITSNLENQTPNMNISSDVKMCGDYDSKELHTNLITGSVLDCNNGNTSNNCIDPEDGQNDTISKHSCMIVELNANTAASVGMNNKNCSIDIKSEEEDREEIDIAQNSTGEFVLNSKSGKLKDLYFESEDKSSFDNLSNCAEIGKNSSSSEHIESNISVKDTNNISYTITTNVQDSPLASSTHYNSSCNLSNSLNIHSTDLHKPSQLQINIRTCKSDVAIAEYEDYSETPSRSSFNNTKSTNNTHGNNTYETSDRMLEDDMSSNKTSLKTTSESHNTDISISCLGNTGELNGVSKRSHSICQEQSVQCITTDKITVSPLENCLAKIPNSPSGVNTMSEAIYFLIQNNINNANNNSSVMSISGSKILPQIANGSRRAILPKPVDQHQSSSSNIAQTFTISKVSDTGLIQEKKNKKKERTELVSESSESFHAYPVNYDKAKTIIKSKKLNKKTIPVRMVAMKSTARKSTSRNTSQINLNPSHSLKPLLQKALYMPPKDKLKDFKGRFLVGKVNGAFICFKCKSNFSESKQFRWHLWYHIHLNAEKCVTCNSTDPFQPCDTTDNLVETVSNLENEQIFFVMAKEDNQSAFENCKSLNTTIAGPTLPSYGDDVSIPELAPPLLCSPPTTQQSSLPLQSPPILLPTSPLQSTLTNSNPGYMKTEPETQSHQKCDDFLAIKILNTFSLSTGEIMDSDSIDLAAGKSTANNGQSPQVSCTTLDSILDRSITPLQKSVRGEFFKCSMCNFSSLFETYFEEHIFKTHGSSQSYKCFYCEFETLDKNTFIKHYREHLNSVRCESLFVCAYPGCSVRANNLDQHLQHIALHENWKPSCSQCNYTSESVNVISDHYKKCLISLFSCPYCNAKAVDKHTYLQHVSQEHSLKARMVMVKKILVCNILKSFQAINHSEHIDTSPAKPSSAPEESISSALIVRSPPTDVCFSTFLCQKCSFLCNDKKVFLYHKKLHSVSSNITGDMPYTCPCCPDSFDDLDLMLPHLDHHDEDFEFGLFQCPLDGFITNDKAKGKVHLSKLGHIKVNLFLNKVYFHKSKIYHCTLCGIKVKDRDIFMKHLFIHRKDSESVASMLQQPQYTEPITIYNPSFHRLNTSKNISSPSKKSPQKITKQQVSDIIKSPQQEKSNAKKMCTILQEPAALQNDVTSTEIQNNDDSDTDHILDQTFVYENSVPFVSEPVNMVVKASPSFRYNAQALDLKLNVLYTYKSGFFVCSVCNDMFRVKNLLNNHLVEHLDLPYQCSECGIHTKSYDSTIFHALKYHNMERINIIYSQSINEKIHFLARSVQISNANTSPATKEEFSKSVQFLRQPKTFQTGNKTKGKVFTSVRLFNTDDRQHSTSGCDGSIINSESEKLSFLQEKESGQALMTLLIDGPECNSCVICNKSFPRSSIAALAFKEHVLTKHLQYEPFKCTYCSFTAYSQKSFSVHCLTRHADLDIVIESRNIKDMVGLLKQTLDSESNDYFENPEANDSRGSSNQPSNGLSTTSSYNCQTCNAQFNCPFKLLRHKKVSHSKNSTTNTARKSTMPCSNAIKSLHSEASNLDKPSNQQIAKKSTTNRVHKRLVSKLDKNAYSLLVMKKFICQKCNFITEKKKRSMIYHFKKHGFECFVECPHCQAKYTNLKLILKHFELIHKGEPLEPKYLPIEDYFIPISEPEIPIRKRNKQISSPAFDPIIRESHLPFICVFCKLEEVKEEYMRYHLYIHLDYKPFGCGACSRTFSDTIQQRQHLTKDHPSDKQNKVVFKKLKIYEEQVTEIMRDCRRSVQADKNYQSWNLEAVQNDLLENLKKSELEPPPGSGSENEMDCRTDVLSKLLKISSQSIYNSSSTDKTISNYVNRSYIQAKAVEIHEENKISTNRKTRSLSDYVSLKRKSFDENMNSVSINKKLKMTDNNDKPIKNNLIELDFRMPKESLKTSKSSVKRSIDCVSDAGLRKIPNYLGDYDSKHILCYYCSFTSESITAVISHTQQEHVGRRSAIGLLWIDTITGGTYDQEGHIFSNGFDREVIIEYPFLCGTCNYRATELSDVLQHEELNHLELKTSAVILVKKSKVGGAGRDRTSSYFPPKRQRMPKEKVNTKAPTDATITKTAEDTLVSEVMRSGLKYNCSICSVVSNTEYHFRLHLASHDDFRCLVPDLSQNSRLKCLLCSYRAPDENKFTKHMMCHNGPKLRYICGYCGFLADSTRSIKMHHYKRHPGQKFDITKFVDKKQTVQNLSLLVDFDPKVKLDNFVHMSQDRFKYIVSKGHINFEK